jgi:ABC-2 type transport system permease protein
MMSASRLFAIVRKELIQLRRDRLTFGMIVGIPIVQMLLFGYAINTDVRDLRAAVANQSGSHLSRQFLSALGETQVLDFVAVRNGPAELEELLRQGKVSVAVLIPRDFDRRVLDARRPAVQLLVDGSDPAIFGVARQLANMPLGFDTWPAQSAAAGNVSVRPYYNPERRTPVNVIPGLIAIILTLTMMLFTAVAVVRERERGNLELLITTPVSTGELMTGKILPYVLIGMLQLALILAVGDLLFDVPMRGSLLDLYLAAVVFIAANLSLGLLLSTAAHILHLFTLRTAVRFYVPL